MLASECPLPMRRLRGCRRGFPQDGRAGCLGQLQELCWVKCRGCEGCGRLLGAQLAPDSWQQAVGWHHPKMPGVAVGKGAAEPREQGCHPGGRGQGWPATAREAPPPCSFCVSKGRPLDLGSAVLASGLSKRKRDYWREYSGGLRG